MIRLKDAVRHAVILVFIFSMLPFGIYGQEKSVAQVTGTYAITNVQIKQAPGRTIEKGTVVIKDGIIISVGSSVAIPAEAKVIQADSMYLYAGFIDGMSHVGLEPPKETRRVDVEDPGNPPNDLAGIQPERSVSDMIDPKHKTVDGWRKSGFTTAHVVPYGLMLPGTGAVVMLTGDSPDAMVYKNNTSFFSQLEGGPRIYPNTVIGVMAKYRDLYRNAVYAKEYKSRYVAQGGNGMKAPESNRVLEAFYPVVEKSLPVAFRAESVLDIQRVLTLKNDLGFNLMLGDVKQGWDITDKIKQANAKVFLSLKLPELKEEKEETDSVEVKEVSEEEKRLTARKDEMIMNYYKQPALFSEKGITYGFSTLTVEEGDVKSTLQKMVANGLSEDRALAALTTSPASLLGLSNTMGSVDVGKIANLVITDKSYFEKDSNVRMVFVNGQLYEYEPESDKKDNQKKSAK